MSAQLGVAGRLGQFALLISGSAAVATLAGVAASSGNRGIAAVGLAFCIAILAILLRNLTVVLLFVLVLAISYNRQFYSFDSFIGDYGPFGLYWTFADVVLVLLALSALIASAFALDRAEPAPRRSLSIEPAMLVLIAAMLASGLRLETLAPAMFETLRIVKYLAMFLILRAMMSRDMAMTLLAALGFLVCLQFALGAMQVALAAGGAGLSDLREQAGELARRATGTLGHPNMYAPFLMTFSVGFVSIGLACARPVPRLFCLGTGGAGFLAVILSQSRAPVGAMAVAIAMTALTLALRHRISSRRLLGGALLASVVLLIALAPLADKILQRLTGDFQGSIEFRAEYNQSALAIWRSAPILGVGPSGFIPALEAVDPMNYATNAAMQSARQSAHVRTIAPVHNVYLWVLAETGIVGLGALVLFLASLARLFWRAGRGEGVEALFFTGVFWGYLGLLAEQLGDFSLWWDHQMGLLMILAAFAAYRCDSEAAA